MFVPKSAAPGTTPIRLLSKPKAPGVNAGSPALGDLQGSSSWVIQAPRAIFRPKNSRRMIHEEPETFVHFTSLARTELHEKYPKLELIFPLVNG